VLLRCPFLCQTCPPFTSPTQLRVALPLALQASKARHHAMQAQALAPAAAGGELRPLLQQLLEVCQQVQGLGAAAEKSARHTSSEAGASDGSQEDPVGRVAKAKQALERAASSASLRDL
jgi:hypothetical protein